MHPTTDTSSAERDLQVERSRASSIRYAEAALRSECAELSRTAAGRNHRAFRAAVSMGRFVGAGLLARPTVENALFDAQVANGYVAKDGTTAARSTIKSGLDRGVLDPREPLPTTGRPAAPADPAELARLREAQRSAEAQDRARRSQMVRLAVRTWREAGNPQGKLCERHFRQRRVTCADDIAGSVLRFHPACPFGQTRMPAIVACMRDITTGELRAIHRTALSAKGQKIDRKMLAPAAGTAIMFDRLDDSGFLVVGEGWETVLTAREHLELRPAWALGSSVAIGNLPVLDGVRTLIVLGENDRSGASAAAVERVGRRWQDAGRRVEVIWPPAGASDINDLVRERAAA
ncbi:DUF7146 domain-containing protein [Methylobacterium radiotolerans]|uniref:DUF7146 domain-containing protein n=1 Tax=Methylobacterium radiotolerans TaxID=31998 RepID=UPI00097763A0|nr:toprim domain-containing protein [Methylobacterium radiotolerans]ONF46457.1 hypothetical protein RSM1_24465 [Methylobacterium radiotolerans]